MTKLKSFRTSTHWGDWTPTGRAFVVMYTPADAVDAAIMVEMGKLCGMIQRHEVKLPYNPEEQ